MVDGIHAVLLVGEDEHERVVPRAALPPGAQEGTWLLVSFEGETLVCAAIDAEKTEMRRSLIAEKMARLRERSRPASTP